MFKKLIKYFGYALMASAFYGGLMAFVNKSVTEQIPDIKAMGEYPVWHLLGIHIVIFILGLALVIMTREKKDKYQ